MRPRPSQWITAVLLVVVLGSVDAWRPQIALARSRQGLSPNRAPSPVRRPLLSATALSLAPTTELDKGQQQQQQCVFDLSSFGLLYLHGEDTRRFLHNQMTNDFINAAPGAVLESSYTTSLGRTIDLVTVLITAEHEAWVLCSPNRVGDVAKTMGKYIFPLDRVKLADRTGEKAILAVVGAGQFGDEPAPAQGSCRVLAADGTLLAAGTGLGLPGYLLLVDEGAKAEAARTALRSSLGQAEWGGLQEWQALRIVQGRPYPDKELTPEVTPLEAGLWHTVSFTKGCYLGQETITKVANNHGERQRLFGFRADAASAAGVQEGARLVTSEGARAGAITSVLTPTPGMPAAAMVQGLAYVRKNMGGPGSKLVVDGSGAVVEVVDIPYATRTDVTSEGAAVAAAAAAEEKKKTEESAELKAKEAERKAKKLEEMKKRLEAFQKAKGGGAAP